MGGIWGISLRKPHPYSYNKGSNPSLDFLTVANVSHLCSYKTPRMSDTSGEFCFLPVKMDENMAAAVFKNGMLKPTLPKAAAAKARHIAY